ncbi:hypothetical protein [Nocardiopsis sp. NPDC006938]|uniref:hypothetical protein n=1 Tax=Nocardiopsis sp. NPDC006938 TaxID=3364337 RepID=UPI0036BE6DE3
MRFDFRSQGEAGVENVSIGRLIEAATHTPQGWGYATPGTGLSFFVLFALFAAAWSAGVRSFAWAAGWGLVALATTVFVGYGTPATLEGRMREFRGPDAPLDIPPHLFPEFGVLAGHLWTVAAVMALPVALCVWRHLATRSTDPSPEDLGGGQVRAGGA